MVCFINQRKERLDWSSLAPLKLTGSCAGALVCAHLSLCYWASEGISPLEKGTRELFLKNQRRCGQLGGLEESASKHR